MAVKVKLIDITKLKKADYLIAQESQKVLRDAKTMLDKQEEFMKNGGMNRQQLRAFINSDFWTSRQRQKAREELLNFHKELKESMASQASIKRKELSTASRLLEQGIGSGVNNRSEPKKRSGYV